MPKRLISQLALVTGASSGLGKALCQELSKQNIPLLLVARDEKKLKETALGLPSSSLCIRCDLSQSKERKNLIAVLEEKEPDLIINNAGFGFYGPLHSRPLSHWQEMVEVNIQALVELCSAAMHSWITKGQKGTILNISSAAAFFPYPYFSVYAATKAFVNSFSQALDQEGKEHGIRVLCVCPGQIDTAFRKKASENFSQKKSKFSMPVETAAKLILKEVQKGSALPIIDWRYRIAIHLSRLLPHGLLQAFLKRSLQDRF